jgi:hypothetical protein
MTSVEQRMADALSDLEAMLNDGMSPDKAILAAATEYSFKPEALNFRAQKVLGELHSVRARNVRRNEMLMREHKAETAISRYLTENPDSNFPDWFEAQVGRPATKAEHDEFTKRYMTFLVRDMRFEI